MEREERSDRFTALGDRFADYTVYDQHYDKIGKVDDLFVDENDQPEYIGVKIGFLGRKSTLIPMDIVRVNEADKAIEVSESKDHVKDAPSFDDDEDITHEYEERIRSHFGLESPDPSRTRGSYDAYSGARDEERYTAEEVARRGREVYERYIQREVESNNQGRFLVLDIKSGKYALSDKELEAFEMARKKAPHGVLYLLRVGHPTAHRTGVRFVSDSRP